MRARGRARAVTLVAVSAIVAVPLWYLACAIADAPESGKPCPCSGGFVCDTYSIFDGGPEGGQCVSVADHPCEAGLTYCGGYGCTDLETDPANCGACSASCVRLITGGDVNSLVGCAAGRCMVEGCGIRDGVMTDGGSCMKNATDCDDAGCACGEQACLPGFKCLGAGSGLGACACTPKACQSGGSCTMDVCRCGADDCAFGEVCQEGACSCPSNDGGDRCPPSSGKSRMECCRDTGCVDVHALDAGENCGACGVRCPPQFFCNAARVGVRDDLSPCACTTNASCKASGGARAICLDAGSDLGLCVCGDDNSTPCSPGQRCTTAGQGKAGCM
jgi:hypothetical protein